MKLFLCVTGETEEEFATRLAKNLEDLILKEGPETVKFSCRQTYMYAIGPKHTT